MNSQINEVNISCVFQADRKDYAVLTEIAFAAKRHWNYPDEYFSIWKDELTITEDYITKNRVYKFIIHDLTVAFYSIVESINDFYSGKIFVKKGFWLEHIFVNPEFHSLGIGSVLIEHVKSVCKKNAIKNLFIFVDPFAKGFYDRIGAVYLYDSPSSVPDRMIPVYQLEIGY